MYKVSQEFLDSLDNSGRQYVLGEIRLTNGETLFLDDTNLIGFPEYSRRCTADEDVFGLGQLVTGTAKITVRMSEINRAELKGGELRLRFKVDNADDWIPLGEWIITEPTRRSQDVIDITAEDCISRLDVAINDNTVGVIDVAARMKKVEELTGIVFAQTPDEVVEMMNSPLSAIWGTAFCATCREEVSAIARFIGGFAYCDRRGRITFRKLQTKPVLTIKAKRRHSIDLAEYTFAIRGVSYTDRSGYTYAEKWAGGGANTSAVISLSGIPYVWDSQSDNKYEVDGQYAIFLAGTLKNVLDVPVWTPGEIVYYGNPALDLGDIVEVEGGINGEESTLFMITSDNWKFRGGQTLISAGAGSSGTGSSGTAGSGGNNQLQQLITQVNVEKNIVVVNLETAAEILDDKLKTIARGAFSVREETTVFADITANIRSLSDTEIHLNLLYDGVKQTVHAAETMSANECRTIHFTAHLKAAQGKHTVAFEARGNAEMERITAIVWGQNITYEQPEPAFVTDYLYTIESDGVTVDKYIGSGAEPTIPRKINNKQVKTLAADSFMGTNVRSAFIPDGTEVIL